MKKQYASYSKVKVTLHEIGEVDLVSPGPLTIRLVKMLIHNGLPFTESWLSRRGYFTVAHGFYYDNKLQQVMESTVTPMREFLIGIKGDKLYRLTDHKILSIRE